MSALPSPLWLPWLDSIRPLWRPRRRKLITDIHAVGELGRDASGNILRHATAGIPVRCGGDCWVQLQTCAEIATAYYLLCSDPYAISGEPFLWTEAGCEFCLKAIPDSAVTELPPGAEVVTATTACDCETPPDSPVCVGCDGKVHCADCDADAIPGECGDENRTSWTAIISGVSLAACWQFEASRWVSVTGSVDGVYTFAGCPSVFGFNTVAGGSVTVTVYSDVTCTTVVETQTGNITVNAEDGAVGACPSSDTLTIVVPALGSAPTFYAGMFCLGPSWCCRAVPYSVPNVGVRPATDGSFLDQASLGENGTCLIMPCGV